MKNSILAHTRKSKKLKYSFEFNYDVARRLYDVFSKRNKEFKIEITCSDSSIIVCPSLEYLLDFPNTKTREIKALSYESSVMENESIEVEFSKSEYPIRYSIRAEDEVLLAIERELKQIFEISRKWWTWLYRVYPFDFLVAILLLSWPVAPFISSLMNDGFSFYNASALSVMSGLAILLFFMFRFIPFPRGAFLIGHGIERSKVSAVWRGRAIGGLLVSIVGGLIVALVI